MQCNGYITFSQQSIEKRCSAVLGRFRLRISPTKHSMRREWGCAMRGDGGCDFAAATTATTQTVP